MKKYEIPNIQIKEFNKASILTASETTNMAEARNYLAAEKGLNAESITATRMILYN